MRWKTNTIEKATNPHPPLFARHAVDAQWIADDLFDRHSRIERGERVLKNDLEIGSSPPEFVARKIDDINAIEPDAA